MKRALVGLLIALCLPMAAFSQTTEKIDHLQNISVTIRAGSSQGSGTLITRKRGEETLTFVLTCGHVVDGLRKTREVIDPSSGTKKTAIEFSDAAIVQEFRQHGRRIGETKMDAQVLRYSDADTGDDLALLRVRKIGFTTPETSATFYLEEEIPPLGTKFYHVGSLLGQVGANSLTTGVQSQQGRVLDLGANGVVFDQVTCTSFPGSSGGGVFLEHDGRYVAMVVRGAGEGFTLVVPMRRISSWAKRSGIEWALNPAIDVPSDEQLAKIPVEDAGVAFQKPDTSGATKAFPFLIAPITDSLSVIQE